MKYKDTPAIETIKAILETEKEISLKAGMREVIDWVKSHSQHEKCDPDTMPYFSDFFWIDESDWQAFLKEKGIQA